MKEYLNYFDKIIVADKYERSYMENLENVRRYVIKKTDEKQKIIMLDILSNMNDIIEKFYDNNIDNFVDEYETLRNNLLIWSDAMIGHIQ